MVIQCQNVHNVNSPLDCMKSADLVLLIVAWISGAGCRSLEQMPGSLGSCPGAAGCADLLIFADFVGCLPWVKLQVWSGYYSWQHMRI